MKSFSRALVPALVCLIAITGCKKEEGETSEAPTFSFTVYPGARYLAQLTELRKKALQQVNATEAAAPMAMYDVDAPVEQVAEYYAKAYGYEKVAPDASNNLSVTKPPAFYRVGDLGTDNKDVAPLLQKIGLNTDVTKAQGKYKAAEIESKPNRPHVTIQRPYFDVSTSQVVDRTLILMAR